MFLINMFPIWLQKKELLVKHAKDTFHSNGSKIFSNANFCYLYTRFDSGVFIKNGVVSGGFGRR